MLRGQDEKFWQAVFVAAIKAGETVDAAAVIADKAVLEFRHREARSFD